MRAEQSKFLASLDSVDEGSKSVQEVKCEDEDVGADSKELAEVVCSLCHDPDSKDPMSFLILLQVSNNLVSPGIPCYFTIAE